jgi:hypothetical protein
MRVACKQAHQLLETAYEATFISCYLGEVKLEKGFGLAVSGWQLAVCGWRFAVRSGASDSGLWGKAVASQ